MVIFLLRVSILTRDIDIAICLSVCPSVRYVPVLYENGLTYCYRFFTVRYPNHSTFISIKHLHEIPTVGMKISHFSTNRSLYLVNNTR